MRVTFQPDVRRMAFLTNFVASRKRSKAWKRRYVWDSGKVPDLESSIPAWDQGNSQFLTIFVTSRIPA